VEALDDFGSFDSPLGYHPDRKLAPGVEISSGSLGHGLGVAVGAALTGRRVFCLVGDAELDEGSNWEAVQYAGRVGLGSLTDDRGPTTTRPNTAGRKASSGDSRSRAGSRSGSTGATTRRSKRRSHPFRARPAHAASWRRWRGVTAMRERFYELAREALDENERWPS